METGPNSLFKKIVGFRHDQVRLELIRLGGGGVRVVEIGERYGGPG